MNQLMHDFSLQDEIRTLESRLFDESHCSEIGRMYQKACRDVFTELSGLEQKPVSFDDMHNTIKKILSLIAETDKKVSMGDLPCYGVTNV